MRTNETAMHQPKPVHYIATVYIMGNKHAERMRLPFNDFCHGCRSAEEEESVIHFFRAEIDCLALHFLST